MSLADLWPASGIRVRAGELELRWIDDELLAALAELASRGIHAPEAMPFGVPWTRGTPEEVARSVLAYQWSVRGQVSPGRCALELAVLDAGVPVGIQGFTAASWQVTREAETGSWLGREHQGRRIGRRMRALMLHLLFEGLGAERVTSAAFDDNAASRAVSRALDYDDNGVDVLDRDGVAVRSHRFAMGRERWASLRPTVDALLGAEVEITGVGALRGQLGG